MKHDVECPSCSSVKIDREEEHTLSHWPIQIKLMGTVIPFLENADLMVAADCTGFATAGFHNYLGDKKLLIGCPKLDDGMYYLEKFTEIFSKMGVKTVTCLRMEVPCCGGMTAILKEAIKRAGKDIPLEEIVIGVKGNMLGKRAVPAE
ncbi:MAG: hypothetical protein M0Z52_03200 [Actinomycetota bacterium]|nr:hypothetical protein [Actinomycetota bacterium]